MTITWLNSVEEFLAHRKRWNALLAYCADQATAFHSAEWIEARWRYPANRMLAALAENGDAVVAGFVFNAERDFGSAVLWPVRLLGMTPHISNAFPSGLSYLVHHCCYYPLVRGHNKTYAKQSPGNLLAEESIEFFNARGVDNIYLGAIHLSQNTKYKTNWMTHQTTNENILLIRRNTIYERVDRMVQKDGLTQKIWWKLRLGERLRRWYQTRNIVS